MPQVDAAVEVADGQGSAARPERHRGHGCAAGVGEGGSDFPGGQIPQVGAAEVCCRRPGWCPARTPPTARLCRRGRGGWRSRCPSAALTMGLAWPVSAGQLSRRRRFRTPARSRADSAAACGPARMCRPRPGPARRRALPGAGPVPARSPRPEAQLTSGFPRLSQGSPRPPRRCPGQPIWHRSAPRPRRRLLRHPRRPTCPARERARLSPQVPAAPRCPAPERAFPPQRPPPARLLPRVQSPPARPRVPAPLPAGARPAAPARCRRSGRWHAGERGQPRRPRGHQCRRCRCSPAGCGGHRRRRAVVIEPGQGQEIRGLKVASGEVFHRVTGSASAAAGPGIWPGGLQRAPAASAGCAALRAP